MSKLNISTEKEFNDLYEMYNSEGFSLYLQFVDGEIQKHYNYLMSDSISKDEMVQTIGKIKGLSTAKNVAYNIIKENEGLKK